MIQFGTIKFRRAFKNHFGHFVWIGKKSHYNSRVSLHKAPTKKAPQIEVKITSNNRHCNRGVVGKYIQWNAILRDILNGQLIIIKIAQKAEFE